MHPMETNWIEPYTWLFCRTENISRKNDIAYWRDSFIYLRTMEDAGAMVEEYIGHHLDFFRISIIAQAARDGIIDHSEVTKAVLSMVGVDDDPGDTEVPVDWNGEPIQ